MSDFSARFYSTRFGFWWNVHIRCRFWKVLAWIQWLPHRKRRAELCEEFRYWGTPMHTLSAMSRKMERTEAALKRAWEGWAREEKARKHAELLLASDRVSQSTRKAVTDMLGVNLDQNQN